jgi:hypothetical protein
MGWQSSSGVSSHGFPHSSWIDRRGAIALASNADTNCEITRDYLRSGQYTSIMPYGQKLKS